MNIQGYGSGSFADIMNSYHKRNQIQLVNQIVSYKDTEDGEIYRAYFTDDKVTSHNAVGQKAWETAIKDASHIQKIKESLGGITLYSQDSAIRESDSSDNGRAIGVTTVGNIGYIARYADSSTPENPVIKIGNYEVLVNEVDPHNATQLEMFALLSYLDDTNQTNNTGMSSFSKLRTYAELAEANGFCEEIRDVNAFYDKNQNWEEIMRAIKEVFLGNPQTYEQGLNCDMLINIMSGDKKFGFIAEFGNYEEFHKAWMSQGAETPFSYTESKGFNEAENSISLVQGMAARLNNGFVLSITDSMVYPEGDFRDNAEAKESAAVASALSHLIKVANGQIPMNMFYSKNQDNSAYAKMGLEAFGIDTSRPFTINEKTFHYDSEGQIRLGSGE